MTKHALMCSSGELFMRLFDENRTLAAGLAGVKTEVKVLDGKIEALDAKVEAFKAEVKAGFASVHLLLSKIVAKRRHKEI
jgi:hypothetical protein